MPTSSVPSHTLDGSCASSATATPSCSVSESTASELLCSGHPLSSEASVVSAVPCSLSAPVCLLSRPLPTPTLLSAVLLSGLSSVSSFLSLSRLWAPSLLPFLLPSSSSRMLVRTASRSSQSSGFTLVSPSSSVSWLLFSTSLPSLRSPTPTWLIRRR